MTEPPLSLYYPTYVVEYAVVDDTVTFMDRRTLNVGGQWLGRVPKLAICKTVGEQVFWLSHCSDDWQALCSVETASGIEEIRATAERHYQGISAKWQRTAYTEELALADKLATEDSTRCSFCGASAYGSDTRSFVTSASATICNVCVEAFHASLSEEV
jgi:hypothetical protein